MPVLPTGINLVSPPSNAYGLVQYLSSRLPGYDPSEHLRELNSSYIHVWEEVCKLRNNYFTTQKVVTVAKAQAAFDLLFNADGGLNAAVSARLYQITRIRVMPPSGGLFQTGRAVSYNDPDFVGLSSNPTATTPATTGPYWYLLFGRGNVQFVQQLAIGSQIEVTYTFWPLALTYQAVGSVSSSGSTVTGSGTQFTQMVQPDFATALPLAQAQEEIQCELVCNPGVPAGGQVYRVAQIASDTSLTTATAIAPVLAASAIYVLATLPEIPREHIRVIASAALRNMYSVAGDDSRVKEWAEISASNMQAMKDSLIERQGQNPPTKGRFQFGIGRRNRRFF